MANLKLLNLCPTPPTWLINMQEYMLVNMQEIMQGSAHVAN